MKNDRQTMILEIISQENIETQEQLLARLQERGITSTQATISRDIKQMHLIKEPVGQGVYKYAVSGNRTKLNFAEKLRTIFRESITSIAYAQNIVVLKTMPGLASAACSALDNMDITYMVGSSAFRPAFRKMRPMPSQWPAVAMWSGWGSSCPPSACSCLTEAQPAIPNAGASKVSSFFSTPPVPTAGASWPSCSRYMQKGATVFAFSASVGSNRPKRWRLIGRKTV